MAAAIGGGYTQIRLEVPEEIKKTLLVDYFVYTNEKPVIAFCIFGSNYYVYDFEKEVGAFAKGTVKQVRSTTYLELIVNKPAVTKLPLNEFIKQANSKSLVNNSKNEGPNYVVGSSNFFRDDMLRNIGGGGLPL